MRNRLGSQLLIIAMLAGCSASSVRELSLCDLRLNRDREKFAGQMLSVTGELLVSKHGSAVIEPTCDGGVPITWHDDDVPRMRKFDAIAERLGGLEPFVVTVRVTGEMKRAPRGYIDEPYWYLDLTSAEVLGQRQSGI
jgi:hypothetical protein